MRDATYARNVMLIRARQAPHGFHTSWARQTTGLSQTQAYRVLRQLAAKGLVEPYPKGGGFWRPVMETPAQSAAPANAARHLAPRIQFRIDAALERGDENITIGVPLARELVDALGQSAASDEEAALHDPEDKDWLDEPIICDE